MPVSIQFLKKFFCYNYFLSKKKSHFIKLRFSILFTNDIDQNCSFIFHIAKEFILKNSHYTKKKFFHNLEFYF